MRTYNAIAAPDLLEAALAGAVPYLFTSLKVAVAISLVGAIVGELPTGAVAGLGARLLAGSYYGQTVQIWAALFMAAALAGCRWSALIGLAPPARAAADGDGGMSAAWLVFAALFWLAAWLLNEWLVRREALPIRRRRTRLSTSPCRSIFGVTRAGASGRCWCAASACPRCCCRRRRRSGTG